MRVQASGLIQCGSCGRKLNETDGQRHIAFCEKKAMHHNPVESTKTEFK